MQVYGDAEFVKNEVIILKHSHARKNTRNGTDRLNKKNYLIQ